MARSIEFDAQALIGSIDALRGAQLPYAGNQALWALKPKLDAELRQEMQRKFKNPVQFTLSSPRFRIDGLEMTVGISKKGDKGQDPARYLYPVTEGGDAYITRFTRAIRALAIVGPEYYAIPFLKGVGVRKNAYGNMSPGQYQQVLAGLKVGRGSGKAGSQWRYISIPDGRKAPRGGGLKPGIYRIKGRNEVNMLFTYARKHPQVPALFDFEGVVRDRSETLLPSLLSKALDNALK